MSGDPDTKILFMSGYAGDLMNRYGVLEPGVTVLPKPFTNERTPHRRPGHDRYHPNLSLGLARVSAVPESRPCACLDHGDGSERQRERGHHRDAHVAVAEAEMLVEPAHVVVAALGPGVDLPDSVLGRPAQASALERGGHARPRQSRRTAVKACSARSGVSASKYRAASPPVSPSAGRQEHRLRRVDPVAAPTRRARAASVRRPPCR